MDLELKMQGLFLQKIESVCKREFVYKIGTSKLYFTIIYLYVV